MSKQDDEDGLTREEKLLKWDAEITAELKGPMPNIERNLLVAERADIRAELMSLRARAVDGGGR